MRAAEFAKRSRRRVKEQQPAPQPGPTGLTFRGYPCTRDCGGHRAGYDWATYWGITDPNLCPLGGSNSFWEGCKSRGEEQD